MTYTSDNRQLSVNVLHDSYRFKKKLGKGGFSDVFLAEKRDTGEYVAIKMMKTGNTDEDSERKTARFRREMLLYGQLDYPNIVKVIDSGETDNGILFIVFEYIKGKNLAYLLKKEGSLSLPRTVNLMKQVLSGLGEAHAKGIIHRDLKPENIMIVADETSEQVKILDFGISTFVQRPSDDATRLTMTREFLGTPIYSAPEQLRGEAVSVKVDIYAWGLIFLECITGTSPFSGQTIPAIVQQQLASSPVPLPTAIINHQLGTLLRWVLEKDVARRAGNVVIIASHLETVSIDNIPQNNGFLTSNISVEESSSPQIMIYETVSAPPERRQVTTLCCIIEMQIAHSGNSNDVIDELYQDLMESGKNLVKRFGAYVANDSGDRIFAYFGFPEAGDTDARRAARSALELANVLSQRNAVFSKLYGIHVTFRIGIHTGTITVRKLSHNIPVLSGIVLNYAGKLCRLARQNSILVSKSSFSLLKDSIELQEYGSDFVSESLHDDQVYKLIGEKRCDSLIDIFTDNLSPMIGRDGELARLCDMWKATLINSPGKAILLQGEAGIGKSRLAAEFAKKISVENGGWLECRCLPEGKNSALHPIFSFLHSRFRIAESSSPKDNCLALEHHLNQYGMDCSIAMPLFGSWLGIPMEGYSMPQFSPQKQKEIILQLSSEILAKTAQDSGAIIMIEDLHWADPTTIEFLPKLFEQVKKRDVMLCMTARPVFVPSWNVTEAEVISLSGLSDECVEEIVRTIFGSEEIGRDTLAKIIGRVDGVPLFIEEIAKLIREKKLNKEEIPATLIDLLTSKMDQLGPARETVQLASVIGREFDYNLIEKVSYKDAASLLADLDHLVSAGVIHIQLVVGNPHYVFHHALVRDAAYESIDKKLRKKMHFKIAEVLERTFVNFANQKSGEIALHFGAASFFEKAVMYGTEAAKNAVERSLNDDTITYCKQVLEWINSLPVNQQKKCELIINMYLTQALMCKYGWADNRVKECADRSLILLDDSQAGMVTISVLWSLAVYHHVAGNRQQVRNLSDNLGDLVIAKNDNSINVVAATLNGIRFQADGEYVKAVAALEYAVNTYDPERDKTHSVTFGFDMRAYAEATLGVVYWFIDDTDKAVTTCKQAVCWARSIGHIPSLCIALLYNSLVYYHEKDKVKALEITSELLDLADTYGFPAYTGYGTIIHYWAKGQPDKMYDVINLLKHLGCKLALALYNTMYADCLVENGHIAEAVKQINLSLTYCENDDERNYEAGIYLKRALYQNMLSTKATELVKKDMLKSVEVAKRQGATRIEKKAKAEWLQLYGYKFS